MFSKKGLRTKLEHFAEAIAIATPQIFKGPPIQGGAYKRLLVDYGKMMELVAKFGGSEVFGSWEDWGDTFALREEQQDWSLQDPDMEFLMLAPLHDNDLSIDGKERRKVMALVETVNTKAFSDHARQLPEGDELNRLRRYIKRIWDEGSPAGGDLWHLTINYYETSTWARLIGAGPCMQKLSRVCRYIGLHGLGLDVDIVNAHASILLVLIFARCTNMGNFSMLQRYCTYTAEWRKFVQKYFGVSKDNAKTELIKLQYGGQPTADIPFLRKLADEYKRAAQFLLSRPEYAAYTLMHKDRKKPLFSKFASLMAAEERKMNDVIVAEVDAATGKRCMINIFDGDVFHCTSIADLGAILKGLDSAAGINSLKITIKPFVPCGVPFPAWHMFVNLDSNPKLELVEFPQMGAGHGLNLCFQDSISVIFHAHTDFDKHIIERCSTLESDFDFNSMRQVVKDELRIVFPSMVCLEKDKYESLGTHAGGYMIHTPRPGGGHWLAMQTGGGVAVPPMGCLFDKQMNVLALCPMWLLKAWLTEQSDVVVFYFDDVEGGEEEV